MDKIKKVLLNTYFSKLGSNSLFLDRDNVVKTNIGQCQISISSSMENLSSPLLSNPFGLGNLSIASMGTLLWNDHYPLQYTPPPQTHCITLDFLDKAALQTAVIASINFHIEFQ